MTRRTSLFVAALLALGMGAGATHAPRRPAKAPVRSPADIVRKRAKQAAKLARRAARANKKPLTTETPK